MSGKPSERVIKDGPYLLIETSSWDEAKRKLQEFGNNWVFRGHEEANWELQTSLERERFITPPPEVAEQTMLREMRRRAHHFLAPSHVPSNTVEWLALMQHYGAPTRLLDWTRSPFVAAYFAVENMKPSGTCAIWCLNQTWCLDRTREKLLPLDQNLLVKFDPSEPNVFDTHILPGQHQLVVPIEPFMLHERLTTQQGIFTCPGDLDYSFMNNLRALGEDPQKLVKITMPGRSRGHALAELNQANINRATLFPGIDGLARSLKYTLVKPDSIQNAVLKIGIR